MSNNWIAILGSPRRGKNTEKIMDYYIEGLELWGKTVEKIVLSEIDLNICMGCEWCIKNNHCHHDDNISIIIEKMKNAEGVILSSPSWNYNVTSYMKIFLDRLFSMFEFGRGSWSSQLGSRGKKAIIIGTCAGPDETSMGYTIESMRRVMVDHGVDVLIEEAYYGTKRNPVETNEKIKSEIRKKLDDVRYEVLNL